MRVLTKSRFKEGLSCPNKLFYTKKDIYANQKNENPFLEALAQGGFQVEELARLHYPNGVLIEDALKYQEPWDKTQELLKNENQIIYESAFMFESLFIRADILEKKGNHVRLIEVKSKSFDPNNENLFIGKRGGIDGGWKPYLFDLAFQTYVVRKCYPNMKVTAHLMLADKTKKATIDGLNQLFRISKAAQNTETLRTGIIKAVETLDDCGASVLGELDLTSLLDRIIAGEFEAVDGMTFQEAVKYFSEIYTKDAYANWPVNYGSCKGCEYRANEEQKAAGQLSGFEQCFKKQLNWTDIEFEKPKTWNIWNFRSGAKLFERGIYFQDELVEDDVLKETLPDIISASERQWIQVEKTVGGSKTPHVEAQALGLEINSWQFPLNFIDFETCMMALPFHKGRRPYEQIAFQFSHHVMHEDWTIEHKSEFIHAAPGEFPNFAFVRALKKALDQNDGSVFKYAAHENTVLNQIHEQLHFSSEPDKEVLMDFIETLTHAGGRKGDRDMIDLCEIVKKYYYNPLFGGSNSLKVVLPAILATSDELIQKYSKPIGEIDLTSLNFSDDKVWLTRKDGLVINPYKTLDPIFTNWSEEELDQVVSELGEIADGGAALTAYSKLQIQEMELEERKAIESALLKYCELDTLAMVMLFEHLNEISE